MIRRGEIWWADLDDPNGSEPGYQRPVLIVSSDAINASGLRTVIVVPISSRTDRPQTRHQLLLPARVTKLPRDSIALAASVEQVNKEDLRDRVSVLPRSLMASIGRMLADAFDLDA